MMTPLATLRERLVNDIQMSMKAGKKERLPVLRGVLTEIVFEEKKSTHAGTLLGDEDVLTMFIREKKKYEEAALFAQQAEREDLVVENFANIGVLLEYLPKSLTEDEFKEILTETLLLLDRPTMGAVLKLLTPKIKGRFDMKEAVEWVKKVLVIHAKEQ